jgi:hypothetical protein
MAIPATNFVNRNGVDTAVPKSFGDALAQVFVQEKAQVYCPWFKAIRASISSG